MQALIVVVVMALGRACGAEVGDVDGDGYSRADGDCDDYSPAIRPQQQEVAGNGIDDNCDGEGT